MLLVSNPRFFPVGESIKSSLDHPKWLCLPRATKNDRYLMAMSGSSFNPIKARTEGKLKKTREEISLSDPNIPCSDRRGMIDLQHGNSVLYLLPEGLSFNNVLLNIEREGKCDEIAVSEFPDLGGS